MDENKGHFIQPRPQISITLDKYNDIVISVTGMDDAYDRVESNDVTIPGECAEEVAQAILQLIRNEE